MVHLGDGMIHCYRHIFGACCKAYSWYMYEVHVLVMLVHVEVHLSDVMVH
jgi:hypothetical protein